MNADLNLLRVVYVSQQAAPAERIPAMLTAILERASAHNPHCGVTGVLACIGGYFLQALEGPPAEVDGLVDRIRRDTRHRDLNVLMRVPATSRVFADWSMAVVECASDRRFDGERFADLVAGKALPVEFDVRSLFQAVCLPAPRAVALAGGAQRRTPSLPQVVVSGASGIWSVALLSSLAARANAVVERIALRGPASITRSTLLEYVDVATASQPPLRVLALTAHQFDDGLLRVLLDRPALLTLLVSISDAADFPHNVQSLFSTAASWLASTPVLLVCNTSPERLEIMACQLRASTRAPVTTLIGRLGDTSLIWAAVHQLVTLRSLARLPDYFEQPTRAPPVGPAAQLSASGLDEDTQDTLTRQLSAFLAAIPGGVCAAVAAPREGVILASVTTATGEAHSYAAALLESIIPLWKLADALGEAFGPGEVSVATTTTAKILADD